MELFGMFDDVCFMLSHRKWGFRWIHSWLEALVYSILGGGNRCWKHGWNCEVEDDISKLAKAGNWGIDPAKNP